MKLSRCASSTNHWGQKPKWTHRRPCCGLSGQSMRCRWGRKWLEMTGDCRRPGQSGSCGQNQYQTDWIGLYLAGEQTHWSHWQPSRITSAQSARGFTHRPALHSCTAKVALNMLRFCSMQIWRFANLLLTVLKRQKYLLWWLQHTLNVKSVLWFRSYLSGEGGPVAWPRHLARVELSADLSQVLIGWTWRLDVIHVGNVDHRRAVWKKGWGKV